MCVCVYSLLVMCDTFSSFFKTESMRDDVWSISSPNSPNILHNTAGMFMSFKQRGGINGNDLEKQDSLR